MNDKQFKTRGALLPFLRRMFTYTMRYPKWLSYFTLCVLAVAFVEASFPVVWMHLLDDVIVPLSQNTSRDLSGLLKYAALYFTLGVIMAASVCGFIFCAGRIQEFVMYDLRQELFKKLQKLSFSYYDKSAVGWLLTRISLDTVKVTEVVSFGLIECVWSIGCIIFCSIAMFLYNWKLALIVLFTLPVLAVISIKIRALILKYSREARKYNSEITAAFNEHINGVEVNKSLVQENRVSGEFSLLSEKMRGSSYKSAYYSALYTPLVIFIGSSAAAFVIYFGGNMALYLPPEITVGTLAAFFGYAALIYEPILDMSRFYSQAQNSISAGERIFSLLDTAVTITDDHLAPACHSREVPSGSRGNPESIQLRESGNPDPLCHSRESGNLQDEKHEFHNILGDIEFENVSFHYDEGHPVFRNLNLKINSGESVALVGETGGGKSTIINLICRFYEPVSGAVKIDGNDYRQKTIKSLRKQLGVVLQTPHLFSGTVRENIIYGIQSPLLGGVARSRRDGVGQDPTVSEDEIRKALELAGAEDFISRLDEQVGEGGDRLSMGEKQLLSFARAILADPRIFIMDEATSSIDTVTEARIQRGIKNIMQGRTSIIIAHRLSTIKNCDKIFVVRKGKITETGNHYELMKQHGYYHALYTRQYREQREKELITL